MDEIKAIFTEVLNAVNQGHPLAFLAMVGCKKCEPISKPPRTNNTSDCINKITCVLSKEERILSETLKIRHEEV
jgi:hypothetical protein